MISAPTIAPPPEGIYPLSARPQVNSMWGAAAAPLPAALRPQLQQEMDPATLVRSVTGAVVAVSAAMRSLNAALDGAVGDPAAVDRAMAALNAAVADQAMMARRVLSRFGEG